MFTWRVHWFLSEIKAGHWFISWYIFTDIISDYFTDSGLEGSLFPGSKKFKSVLSFSLKLIKSVISYRKLETWWLFIHSVSCSDELKASQRENCKMILHIFVFSHVPVLVMVRQVARTYSYLYGNRNSFDHATSWSELTTALNFSHDRRIFPGIIHFLIFVQII